MCEVIPGCGGGTVWKSVASLDALSSELPIAPDFVGRTVKTDLYERVDVMLDRDGGAPDQVIVSPARAPVTL